MPKFIDVKAAAKIGARYDDGKRVSVLMPVPDPAVLAARAEADARQALVDAINALREAVLSQALDVTRLNSALDQLQAPKPALERFVFEHQRGPDGKIVATIVHLEK